MSILFDNFYLYLLLPSHIFQIFSFNNEIPFFFQDNSTSLLHYTVQQYIKKFEGQNAGTDKVKYPLPDPSDLTQGCQVCFDELDKELRRIKKDFEGMFTSQPVLKNKILSI